MFTKYQIVSVLPLIVDIALPILLLGLVMALARSTARRATIALAGAALALIVVGAALIDAVTGLHGWLLLESGDPYSRPRLVVVLGTLIVNAGLSLSFAAIVLALREMAHLSRWGFLAILLVAQALTGISATLFHYPYVSALFNQTFYDQLYRGELAISAPFYLLTDLLLLTAPATALLVSLREISHVGPEQLEPAPLPPNRQ